MKRNSIGLLAAAAIALWGLGAAGPAAATVFCVPGFSVSCPDNGTNRIASGAGPAEKLQNAMTAAPTRSDGIADTVNLAPGIYSGANAGFKPSGSDDLTVLGSGRGQTTLTSSLNTNSYVVNLNETSGVVTMKDLAIVIPESFPDGPGYGAGVQARSDRFLSVDLVNRNPGSAGFANVIDGGLLDNVGIRSENGARLNDAVNSSNCGSGTLVIRNLRLSGARTGVASDCPGVPATVSDARVRDVDWAFQASHGASMTVVNALVESGDQPPFEVYGNGPVQTTLTLDQVTAVATGDPAKPALDATVADLPAATAPVRLKVRNSVFAGFLHSWELSAPSDATRGDVVLDAAYSFFGRDGAGSGDVATHTSKRVRIGGNPGFAGLSDFHPGKGSPLIDAGDPKQALPKRDLDGVRRPVDGDGNGRPVRDIGAFEARPPALALKKVRFTYSRGHGGRLVFRISRDARIRAVFTPVPKQTGSGSKQRAVKVGGRARRAGTVRIRLGRNLLARGRYRLKLTATAAVPGGSTGTGLGRTVRVR